MKQINHNIFTGKNILILFMAIFIALLLLCMHKQKNVIHNTAPTELLTQQTAAQDAPLQKNGDSLSLVITDLQKKLNDTKPYLPFIKQQKKLIYDTIRVAIDSNYSKDIQKNYLAILEKQSNDADSLSTRLIYIQDTIISTQKSLITNKDNRIILLSDNYKKMSRQSLKNELSAQYWERKTHKEKNRKKLYKAISAVASIAIAIISIK